MTESNEGLPNVAKCQMRLAIVTRKMYIETYLYIQMSYYSNLARTTRKALDSSEIYCAKYELATEAAQRWQ